MTATKPKLLDLFCCQGGAGMGYHLAGFDVVGVSIPPAYTEYLGHQLAHQLTAVAA